MRSKVRELLALTVCILPPAAVTLHFFPTWFRVNRVEMVIPGVAVFFLCLAAIPIFRWIWRTLKTPACWMPWVVIWGILELIAPIYQQVRVIVFVGAVSNILGALLFKIGKGNRK